MNTQNFTSGQYIKPKSFCYGCNQYIENDELNVSENSHAKCTGNRSLGVCVDKRIFLIEEGEIKKWDNVLITNLEGKVDVELCRDPLNYTAKDKKVIVLNTK